MTASTSARSRSIHVEAVRDATQTRHRRVEQRLDVRSAFGSVDAYGRMLARLLGFHGPLEDELRVMPGGINGVDPLPRRARLEADLSVVGRDPARVRMHPTPLGLPAGPGGGVGSLYVIEGSALGGAVLARLAERRLGLTATGGASFFHGDAGPATETRWLRVLQAIDAEADAGRLTAVISGAKQTFDALDAWLQKTA